MEDSFRRKEMKGQRHERRDDDVDAEFALWATTHITLRRDAMIIITFSTTDLLNHTISYLFTLHIGRGLSHFTALFPASMLLACKIIAAFKISRPHTVSEPQKAFAWRIFISWSVKLSTSGRSRTLTQLHSWLFSRLAGGLDLILKHYSSLTPFAWLMSLIVRGLY